MRLTLIEKEDGYKILEEGREIYSIREEKKRRTSFYLFSESIWQ